MTCDYQVGHPHGFHNHMYMGEVHHNRPLHDPEGVLSELQQHTAEYPPALRATLLQRFSFEARFSVEIAAKAADSEKAIAGIRRGALEAVERVDKFAGFQIRDLTVLECW